MPCRINRRRLWTSRILLQLATQPLAAFVTLTYEQNPYELVPRDAQLFLKRLRKNYPPRSIHYFLVGEYGDRTYRPHYHAALFGVSILDTQIVEKAWGLGFVQVGELNETTAAYVAGYVCKKMTNKTDPRLEGRYPEFARMSRRPALGQSAASLLGNSLTQQHASAAITRDVPSETRISGKKFPLGRFLRQKVRTEVGWQSNTPRPVIAAIQIRRASMTTAEIKKEAAHRAASNLSAIGKAKIWSSGRTL